MDENLVIQILRDLQERFADFDTRLKKIETEMVTQTILGEALSKLDTQMRGGFEATMCMLIPAQHVTDTCRRT